MIINRESDGFTGARMVSCCPACGETFLNFQYLIRHVEYNQLVEKSKGENFWGKVSHTSIDVALLNAKCIFVPHREQARTSQNQKYSESTTLISDEDKKINLANSTTNIISEEKTDRENTQQEEKLIPEKSLKAQISVDEAKDAIRKHLEETKLEIIVIIEGTDPRTSNSFQSRHSYCSSDIVFDRLYVPCMSVSEQGTAEVNLNLFHQTMPVPSYIDEPPPVASHS